MTDLAPPKRFPSSVALRRVDAKARVEGMEGAGLVTPRPGGGTCPAVAPRCAGQRGLEEDSLIKSLHKTLDITVEGWYKK
jgi:hypothetical protein